MADSLPIEDLPAATVHSVELTAAWAKCVGAWDDEQVHHRALQLATMQQGYAWLAGRYAAVAKQRPDDAVAARQLAKLAQAAEAALAASMMVRSAPSLASKKVSPVMGVVLVLLFLLISGFVMMRVLRAPTTAPATPTGIPRTGH
jgi:pyridoxine 5'-phosphate synthase PdxJ